MDLLGLKVVSPPPKVCAEALTAGTLECDCFGKLGLLRGD